MATLPLDFPPTPIVGQKFTTLNGAVYEWDGYSWTVGFYDSETQKLQTIGDLLAQVRTLLQDVDVSSGQYRYSTDSIITAFNQAMLDMYRIRPDLFLETGFRVPVFTVTDMGVVITIEGQYVPALIYYVVGLVQARDDEQNQDARALGFLKIFQQNIVNGGLA
jgi:hypothetical protein